MTIDEAIKKLERNAYRTTCYGNRVVEHEENLIAIQALEEVQAKNKKVWHHSDEIPDTEDCYIVAWLPKGEQSGADSPHYYAIWSYEDGEWQIYVPNNFADKEIILLAWTELPEPYHKECEENKVIDTDKIVKQIESIKVSKDSNGVVNGCNQDICCSDDCLKCLKKKVIEIIKAGGKE